MQLSGYELTQASSLNATFAALADPTRRAILARLAEGERTVTELAEPFFLSQPAISKHLKVLERARLISRNRDAQRRPSRLEAAPLAEASQWLERYREFWEASFQRLDHLLSSLQAPAQSANLPRGVARTAAPSTPAPSAPAPATPAAAPGRTTRPARDRRATPARHEEKKTTGRRPRSRTKQR